ncbi:hypothetical protein [Bacterioplanoides sp.]|uniref:hypothetical protein n=1 Tax=Bacterioplanoides sp. TaxID=2066072 RepID=UPI003B009799
MKSRLGLDAELPVVDIVKEAIDLLWSKRRDVIQMFLPALLLLSAIDWATQHFFAAAENEEMVTFEPEQLIFMLCSLVLSILLATACHRFTLLPKEQWNKNAIHRFGRNEFSYLLRGIQIGVLCSVAFFILMLGTMALVGEERVFVAVALAIMVVLYVWSRLSITLPEVALGQRSPLSRAWSMSQGNGSRLVVVVWVVPIVMSAPFWLAFAIADSIGLFNYIAAFGVYLTTLVGLVMLSLSYQFLQHFYDEGQGDKNLDEKQDYQEHTSSDRSSDDGFDA